MWTKDTLDQLIDRTMILQAGRREIKKAEQWNLFSEIIEKSWREKELPTVLRRENAEDELALRRKLEARGESLDDVKDYWKTEKMAQELLMLRIQPKVERPGLPDLEAYYLAHRGDPSYHREAKVRWREIVVPATDAKGLPAARAKVLALRARLVAGEDFAAMAKSQSAGVTAANGGSWETDATATAVPAVNVALAKLAPGQVSAPIDGPKGVHLIRVDKRTTAGPAPFVEVQRKIAETLWEERFTAAITVYLKDLRKATAISSPLFDVGDGPPAVARQKPKSDAQARPASAQRNR